MQERLAKIDRGGRQAAPGQAAPERRDDRARERAEKHSEHCVRRDDDVAGCGYRLHAAHTPAQASR